MKGKNYSNIFYYHIFNRGVEKRVVFGDDYDYLRFLDSMMYFNTSEQVTSLFHAKTSMNINNHIIPDQDERLVDILAYSLLPNHYHMLAKQENECGISSFMHKLGMGYTNYFNKKNRRSGALFQGRYKCVEIKDEKSLHYISAYINGNSEIHKIKNAEYWKWSSYDNYLKNKECSIVKTQSVILDSFKNNGEYRDYLAEVIKNSLDLKSVNSTLNIEENNM